MVAATGISGWILTYFEGRADRTYWWFRLGYKEKGGFKNNSQVWGLSNLMELAGLEGKLQSSVLYLRNMTHPSGDQNEPLTM